MPCTVTSTLLDSPHTSLTTPLSEKSTSSKPSSGHSRPLYCFTAPPCSTLCRIYVTSVYRHILTPHTALPRHTDTTQQYVTSSHHYVMSPRRHHSGPVNTLARPCGCCCWCCLFSLLLLLLLLCPPLPPPHPPPPRDAAGPMSTHTLCLK
jgi:hypothetical protein